mgnify:FL=1
MNLNQESMKFQHREQAKKSSIVGSIHRTQGFPPFDVGHSILLSIFLSPSLMNYLHYNKTHWNLKDLFYKRRSCVVIKCCFLLTYDIPLTFSFFLWLGSVSGLPVHLFFSQRCSKFCILCANLTFVFVCLVTREHFQLAHVLLHFTAFEFSCLVCKPSSHVFVCLVTRGN